MLNPEGLPLGLNDPQSGIFVDIEVLGAGIDLNTLLNETDDMAIVLHPRENPMIIVEQGQLADLGGGRWEDHIAPVVESIPSVCRLVPSKRSGTGLVVGERHILTNEHVVRKNRSKMVGSQAWFGWEYGVDAPSGIATVTKVAAEDVGLDLALLEVDTLPPTAVVPRFGLTEVISPNDRVAAIGHPVEVESTQGEASYEAAIQILDPISGVVGRKRVSPGNIVHVTAELLAHDCSTGGGSSGSPLVSLTTGAVIGLHGGSTGSEGSKHNRAVPVALIRSFLGAAGIAL